MSLYEFSSTENVIILYWYILIVSFILTALFFFIQKRKASEDIDRQRIMFIVMCIYLFMGISKLFHIIAIIRQGNFFEDFSLENDLIFSISEIFFYLAIFTIIFAFERRIKHSEKNPYTIILLLISTPFFILRYIRSFDMSNTSLESITFIASMAMNILLLIFVLLLSFMYLRISLKTSGDVRKKALFVFIGFMFLIASSTITFFEEFGMGKDLIAVITSTCSILSIPFLILGYKK